MPTEFRFEDLDLREEPARGMVETDLATYNTYCSACCTAQSNACTKTANCTAACCTDAC